MGEVSGLRTLVHVLSFLLMLQPWGQFSPVNIREPLRYAQPGVGGTGTVR